MVCTFCLEAQGDCSLSTLIVSNITHIRVLCAMITVAEDEEKANGSVDILVSE